MAFIVIDMCIRCGSGTHLSKDREKENSNDNINQLYLMKFFESITNCQTRSHGSQSLFFTTLNQHAYMYNIHKKY